MISRILIVGNGSIAKRHLRIARFLFPSADIRVLKYRFDEKISEYSNGNFFSIEDAVLFGPNVAVIANPATHHIEVASILADVGANLLVEKPLSASTSGVSELISTCQKKSIVLLVGYNLRYLSSLQSYKSYLSGGLIGKILSVRSEVGQYLPNWRPGKSYSSAVSARKELGGGVLLELSHEFDYVEWIFGGVNWVRATLGHQSNLDIDVEDVAHITFMSSPAFQADQILGTISLDFFRHDPVRQCVAIGEGGTLEWNALTGVVRLREQDSKNWVEVSNHPHSLDDSYLAEWKYFIKCIQDQSVSIDSGYSAFRVLEIIDAVRLSNLNLGITQMVKITTRSAESLWT